MKKGLALLLSLILWLPMLPTPRAESERPLLTIGGKSLYDGQSLEEIAAVFGQPRLATPSAFGGQACTYFGADFSDYLYVETTSDGRIVLYATVTPGFTSPGISYGDVCEMGGDSIETDHHTNQVLSACFENYTWNDAEGYQRRFGANEQYLANFQQHTTLMYNAISYQRGRFCGYEFNENLFFINQQLKENGSNLYDYAGAVDKSKYVNLIRIGADLSNVPTPVMFAKYARNYNMPSTASYPCFDFQYAETDEMHYNSSGVYFVNPELIEQRNTVPLTEQEQELLARAREEYVSSVNLHNSVEQYFTEDYSYQDLPLQAGKVDPRILEACVGYLNAIRIAAGLPTLSHSDYYSDASQHKAVLTMYLSFQGIDNPSPHFPPQPDGVPDEFYALAQAGNGENLYHGSILGTDNIIGSLSNALQEAYGDVIACGHRYNLLNPYWESLGMGTCAGQGVHKLNGYQASDVDMVAWPSKGIMLVDANASSYRWTARFYSSRYQVTDSTTVEVTCLNNGKTWSFTDENSGEYEFYRLPGSNQVTFYDDTIAYSRGDVFQITLHNVLADGQLSDYTYRTVFENAYVTSQSAVGGVSLDRSNLAMTAGTQAKLYGKIEPAEAENKWIDWSSSDETVASVSPNGRITAHKPGSAVITATSQDGSYSAQCTVTVADYVFGDINADGSINASDALLALQHSVQLIRLMGNEALAADVDHNEKIDAGDALLILQHSVKLIDQFPAVASSSAAG